MNKQEKYSFVGYWFMRYLSEYIPVIKNQSHNTLTSYRDYYMQYLPFVAKRTGKHADKLFDYGSHCREDQCFFESYRDRQGLYYSNP